MNENWTNKQHLVLKQAVRELKARTIPVGPPAEVLQRVLRAELKTPLSRRIFLSVRRMAAVIAVALAIFGAILGWLKFNNPNAAFARIVEPLLQARSATCHAIFHMAGLPEIEAEVFYKDTGKLRLELDTGINYLIDATDAHMVGMMPEFKTAMEIDFDPMPQAPVPQIVTGWVFELRRQIGIARQNSENKVVALGLSELDGKEVLSYQIWTPQSLIFLWADKDTLALRRMQITIEPITGCPCTIDLVKFSFDTPVDEQLFDTRIPEDYAVQTLILNASEPAESDLLEALQTFTDLTGGHYPDDLTASALNQTAMRYTPQKLLWQFITLRPQTPGMTEILSFLVTQARGLIFARSLPEDCDSHYLGQNVTVNDVDKPVFYYRPAAGGTYRIIYADLTVEEVHPNDLAQIIP